VFPCAENCTQQARDAQRVAFSRRIARAGAGALDPEATRPACERAYAFLMKRGETAVAAGYEARWRAAS
jgi:hypothetical protein